MTAITTRTLTDTAAGTGTITASTSSATVTGSGTSFLSELLTGMQIETTGGALIGTVLNVQSNTSLLLVSNATTAISNGAFNVVSTGITTKAAPLTNVEIDQNFINLNNAVVAGANSSTDNIANTLVKRDPSGAFSAGVITGTDFKTGTVSHPDTNATQLQMESGADTTTRFMSPANVYQAINVLALQSIGNLTKDMTGFEAIAGSTIAYTESSRNFTITPGVNTSVSQTFVVTAAGGHYFINGVEQAAIQLLEGGTYTFDQSDPSNAGHPLRFSTTSNGTHSGGTEYTTGVTTNGTPGSAGAYTRITVAASAPTLYYYCTAHSGMGASATTDQGYYVWFRGKRNLITTTLSMTLSDTAGQHWIGINPTTLQLEEFTSDSTVFTNSISVAVVYLNTARNNAVVVGDERHFASRDTQAHYSNHNTIGAYWKSGGTLGYTLNNDAAQTVTLSSPIYFVDEDMQHAISHNSSPSGYFQQVLSGAASMPTIYLDGSYFDESASSTVPWLLGTTNTVRYNSISGSSGSLVDAPNNTYVNYWIILTNDIRQPVKAVVGNGYYSNVNDAYAESFYSGNLPFADMAVMYRVTLFTNTTYAGNKVRLISVRAVEDSRSSSSKSYSTVSHALLANTTSSDDHTQYIHISNARTVTANHTFNGNMSFGGSNTFTSNTTFSGRISSNFLPNSSSTYDLGSSTYPWRNIYTNDLHLSNEGHEVGNSVDGTKGNWTVQEGETELYIINNKSGKKYKFSLEEIK